MECGLSTVYALSLMSDIDFEEFLFGQALTLATGLALVVAAHSLLVIFN